MNKYKLLGYLDESDPQAGKIADVLIEQKLDSAISNLLSTGEVRPFLKDIEGIAALPDNTGVGDTATDEAIAYEIALRLLEPGPIDVDVDVVGEIVGALYDAFHFESYDDEIIASTEYKLQTSRGLI